MLAAKAAMEAHGIKGSLKFMGEPAEKVCGSKPVHAAKGYYDDMDAAVVWHPSYGHRQVNTPMLETHCGSYWSKVYTFECVEPETWSGMAMGGRGSSHTVARAPGANDALCLMYTTTKYTKEAMLPRSGTWTLNEAILGGGQATSDNLPPRFAQIQYSWRSPRLDMQERIAGVLDNNAEHVAAITHCQVRSGWVTRTRVGLANQALARLAYKNLEQVGPPAFGEEARAFAREIQQNLGFEPMDEPLADEILDLMTPEEGEQRVRDALPPWQLNYTSDDYVDYTWQTPTVRLMIGRATLRNPRPDYQYPAWVWNALGGYPAAIDPTTLCAGRVIAATVLDLLTDGTSLAAAKGEFEERTGGGRGGSKWVAPLLPADFAPPVGFRWPEYVSTIRGEEWWIPETA